MTQISKSRSRFSTLQKILFPAGAETAFALTLLLAFAWPDMALAQTFLGTMICNVVTNMGPVSTLFAIISYIAGAALAGQGLHMLYKHSDSPGQNPLSQAIQRLGAGAALLSAPGFVSLLINTFFISSSGGGLTTCTGTPSVAGAGGLDVLVKNLVNNIKDPLTMMASTVALLVGLFFIVRGLMKASKYGVDPRTNSVTNIVSNLTVGTILVVVGQSLDVVMSSVFGSKAITGGNAVNSWKVMTDLGASDQFKGAVIAALTFFQLIGMIAFVRGWMIVKSAAEGSGQQTMAQGAAHIVGGVLAINIYKFLEIMDATFGTNLL